MATINDVAARAGVGVSTVSRVLNRSPRVSDATRTRVLAAIEELSYRPNPMARGLSRGRCQTLGVVVPFFTHASAVERLRGVVAALDGSRYDLVLFNVESPTHRDEHFAALTRRDRADGLLVLSMPPPADDLSRLAAAGVPVVLVDA
ncbi:MAG: LacI family DNA-binding transcriptional regulator, partial [Acidimicrobiia bacterium]